MAARPAPSSRGLTPTARASLRSLESGYPFAWPQLGPGFVIEPQGQILWQKVSFRHDYDGLGESPSATRRGLAGASG